MTEIDDTARAKKIPVSTSMNHASGPAGMTRTSRKVEMRTTKGAAMNTHRSALRGKMSSFWRNLPTSARSCKEPYGPASIGPSRLCIKLIILNRNR